MGVEVECAPKVTLTCDECEEVFTENDGVFCGSCIKGYMSHERFIDWVDADGEHACLGCRCKRHTKATGWTRGLSHSLGDSHRGYREVEWYLCPQCAANLEREGP